MLLVYILTALDLIAFGNFALFHFGLEHSRYILLLSGFYLIGKAALFRGWMSVPDAIAGVYIILAFIFGFQTFIFYLIFAWMFYKFASVLVMMS
jgi:hypothetical protein